MTKKPPSEPDSDEVAKRLKAFAKKHQEQYPVPPVDENEPEGMLAGNPKTIKSRVDEEFSDDYGEQKPNLKVVRSSKPTAKK